MIFLKVLDLIVVIVAVCLGAFVVKEEDARWPKALLGGLGLASVLYAVLSLAGIRSVAATIIVVTALLASLGYTVYLWRLEFAADALLYSGAVSLVLGYTMFDLGALTHATAWPVLGWSFTAVGIIVTILVGRVVVQELHETR